MKINFLKIFFSLVLVIAFTRCQDFDSLEVNPNVAGENSSLPASYLLGRVLFEVYQGGGVTDGQSGSVFEGPWDQMHRWNQYVVSNDSYYGGNNAYAWTNSATMYNIIRNVAKMEEQAAKTLGTDDNGYAALGKFLRAYAYIWLSQRVGDIPVDEAGQGLENLTPKYNTQEEVYIRSLQLLEDANAQLTALIPKITTATNIGGDIYLGNDLKKWQKVINTYTLRVLISLSKRADDTPSLKIKEKFAAIIGDAVKYPVLTGIADNLKFVYNQQYNAYPLNPNGFYNARNNVSTVLLSLTTSVSDPRTFVFATPAPAELTAGKTISDFSAYVGSNIGKTLAELKADKADDVAKSPYSFVNYVRYYSSFVGPEPYTIIGYSELCFNIAEGINRGWATGDAATWYNNGVKASLDFYGLKDGAVINIGDVNGKPAGTVTASVSDFLSNTNVVYKGDNADGLKQILEQKYVAFFQNSGWEAFYNQRRTGVPVFMAGPGVNAFEKIPARWQYHPDERKFNSENYSEALQRQFGGTDDLYATLWLLK